MNYQVAIQASPHHRMRGRKIHAPNDVLAFRTRLKQARPGAIDRLLRMQRRSELRAWIAPTRDVAHFGGIFRCPTLRVGTFTPKPEPKKKAAA